MDAQQFTLLMETLNDIKRDRYEDRMYLNDALNNFKKEREEDKAEWKKAREEDKAEWKKAREEDKAEWKKAREEDKADLKESLDILNRGREKDREMFLREFDMIRIVLKNETEERRRIEQKVDAVYDERKSIEIRWNAGFLGLNSVIAGCVAFFVSVWK